MERGCVFTCVVNVVWFGLAFWLFALRPRRAVMMLTTRAAAAEASHEALVAALRFLGGMNLAMAALSAAALGSWWRTGAFDWAWLVFFASAVAHASQLAFNVPLALKGGRVGGAPWDVLRGPMALIFVVDALSALLNAAMSALAWSP